MVFAVSTNVMSVKSNYQGVTIGAFPDVCKTPSPGGPVPIPYPNAFGYRQQNAPGSKTPSVAPQTSVKGGFLANTGDEAGVAIGTSKTMCVLQLRGQLQMLHIQIASLPSGDPNRWHKLLDQYVVYTAELYKVLSD